MVELMKFPLIARLVIWFESCTRIWFVSSSGCCCKFLYDSMINAVMTAEKRPAYSRLVSRFVHVPENIRRQGACRFRLSIASHLPRRTQSLRARNRTMPSPRSVSSPELRFRRYSRTRSRYIRRIEKDREKYKYLRVEGWLC